MNQNLPDFDSNDDENYDSDGSQNDEKDTMTAPEITKHEFENATKLDNLIYEAKNSSGSNIFEPFLLSENLIAQYGQHIIKSKNLKFNLFGLKISRFAPKMYCGKVYHLESFQTTFSSEALPSLGNWLKRYRFC